MVWNKGMSEIAALSDPEWQPEAAAGQLLQHLGRRTKARDVRVAAELCDRPLAQRTHAADWDRQPCGHGCVRAARVGLLAEEAADHAPQRRRQTGDGFAHDFLHTATQHHVGGILNNALRIQLPAAVEVFDIHEQLACATSQNPQALATACSDKPSTDRIGRADVVDVFDETHPGGLHRVRSVFIAQPVLPGNGTQQR